MKTLIGLCAVAALAAKRGLSSRQAGGRPPHESWGNHTHKFQNRRSAFEPLSEPVPGFYRVRIGSLVEIGDQMLDETGRPCPISLDQVGREVTRERIVLRIDRRQQED